MLYYIALFFILTEFDYGYNVKSLLALVKNLMSVQYTHYRNELLEILLFNKMFSREQKK